ncbi:hypothetical protein CDEST_01191 [Colletotrichum destructivum]|uniref:Uncharacterized protein n=1 Tax=Colletotrichum destructivum TaxID=34406 RepID=A0AAX4HYL8_9PEZI|nr:hypothetical protein CDEST_01191 [Colletotrichum destructivum]
MRSWELGRSGAMFPCPMAWRRPPPSRCFFDVLRPVEKPVDPWTSPAARRPPQITKAPVFFSGTRTMHPPHNRWYRSVQILYLGKS